ncbi:MAG: hypothetical protein AB1589_13695 [Cyanobacteriota bacterium]
MPHFVNKIVGAGLGDNSCDKADNAQSKPALVNRWVKAGFGQNLSI